MQPRSKHARGENEQEGQIQADNGIQVLIPTVRVRIKLKVRVLTSKGHLKCAREDVCGSRCLMCLIVKDRKASAE